MLPEGTYRVRAVASGIGVSNTSSTPFTRVTFRVLDGAQKGQEIDWIAYVTPKTEERVAQDFRTCGLVGTDLEVLHDRSEEEVAALLPSTVSIVVQHEEFRGSRQARVRWVNPEKKEVSGSIFAGMKAAFAAVDSKNGGAKKPAGGAIRRPTPPPAPEIDDSDVPFLARPPSAENAREALENQGPGLGALGEFMAQKLNFKSPASEISSSVPGIKFAAVEVTPAVAVEWMKRNFSRNRSLNKAAVARYAREMKAGAWRLSHQAIAFDAGGVLVDGQHRLRAVIESGCTVVFVVSYYEDCEAPLEVFDVGAIRPMAAIMEIRGTVERGNGASVSAVLNSLAGLLAGASRKQLSSPDMDRLYAAHREGVDFGARLCRSHKITSSFGAAAAYTYPICPQRIESLFVQAAKNDGLSIYSGAWHLNRLLRLGSQTHSQRLENSQGAIKCVMLHMKDREVKLLKISVEGSLDGMEWAEKERTKLGLFTGLWGDQ